MNRSGTAYPLWLKVAYTLFLVVLVPYYWNTYTAWNFLYFCDVALFFTLIALWTESSLLASIPAIGIVVPQLLWNFDLLSGSRLTGMTAYMFDERLPLFVRALSSFHGWLPFLLLWMVWRVGYDQRAFRLQIGLSVLILSVCYFIAPGPSVELTQLGHASNINYVHGFSSETQQTMMHPLLWLLSLAFGLIVVAYCPMHIFFRSVSAFSKTK